MATVALSEREEQVLRGVIAGKTYSRIAHEMGLSIETVKVYSARVRSKAGVENKVQLAVWGENWFKKHQREAHVYAAQK